MQFCAMIITLGLIPHNKQARHPTRHNTFEEYLDVADVCQDAWLINDLYIHDSGMSGAEDIVAESNDVLC